MKKYFVYELADHYDSLEDALVEACDYDNGQTYIIWSYNSEYAIGGEQYDKSMKVEAYFSVEVKEPHKCLCCNINHDRCECLCH